MICCIFDILQSTDSLPSAMNILCALIFSILAQKSRRINLSRAFVILVCTIQTLLINFYNLQFQILSKFSVVENYEMKDISCHDVMEETVDLHLKWFAAQNGMSGTCFDKHGKKQDYDYGMKKIFLFLGMEYLEGDTIRSCSGCLTFQCVGKFENTAHRNEYFWTIQSEDDVDQHCCLNCLGKVYAEGTAMGVSSTEVGNCTTEVTSTCLYNPGTRRVVIMYHRFCNFRIRPR